MKHLLLSQVDFELTTSGVHKTTDLIKGVTKQAHGLTVRLAKNAILYD